MYNYFETFNITVEKRTIKITLISYLTYKEARRKCTHSDTKLRHEYTNYDELLDKYCVKNNSEAYYTIKNRANQLIKNQVKAKFGVEVSEIIAAKEAKAAQARAKIAESEARAARAAQAKLEANIAAALEKISKAETEAINKAKAEVEKIAQALKSYLSNKEAIESHELFKDNLSYLIPSTNFNEILNSYDVWYFSSNYDAGYTGYKVFSNLLEERAIELITTQAKEAQARKVELYFKILEIGEGLNNLLNLFSRS